MDFITFAIDLGTTNSLIAKHENGILQVYRNPADNQELLPSIVGFRDKEVIVGNKAKQLRDQGFKDVYSSFKRKIGTDAKFTISSENRETDPCELSSIILTELKKFVREDSLESAVITVPASFNTVQANATKLAAEVAGIKEVVLLQEPIAACLSVFNENQQMQKKGKCLVYDLGGGTFDIALINIDEEELRLIDHEGNNFLGGLDFDLSILEKVLIPRLSEQECFQLTSQELLNDLYNGKQTKEFNLLLGAAERLKQELTFNERSELQLFIKNDKGELNEVTFSIDRMELENVILPHIQHSIELTKSVLIKNNLESGELTGIVLVGGATYIPLIRKELERQLGTKCFQPVDPSTAIVRGAAYYASNKPKFNKKEETDAAVSAIYERQTRDSCALVLIRCNDASLLGKIVTLYSSDKILITEFELKEQQQLFIELKDNCLNKFELVLNDTGSVLATLSIEQGKFVIEGQPLPHDICIEVDDPHSGRTKLEVIFEKNKTLPIQRVISKWVNKDLLQGDHDKLIVNLLEGDGLAPPNTCDIIGSIEINPNQIQKNIPQDTEVKIEMTITENRDVEINIQIPTLQYKNKSKFTSTQKAISLSYLKENIRILSFEINEEITLLMDTEEYEKIDELTQLKKQCDSCQDNLKSVMSSSTDIVFSTFERYRKTAVQFDEIQRKNHLRGAIYQLRSITEQLDKATLELDFPSQLKFQYMNLKETENMLIQDGNIFQIKRLREQYSSLLWEYQRDNVNAMKSLYFTYKRLPDEAFINESAARNTFALGDQLLNLPSATAQQYLHVIGTLWNNIKESWKLRSSNLDFDTNGTGLR